MDEGDDVKDTKLDPKYVMLLSKYEDLVKSTKIGTRNQKDWRFENVDGLETMVRKNKNGEDIRYKWCKKDCHPKPTLCLRKQCQSKADANRALSGLFFHSPGCGAHS